MDLEQVILQDEGSFACCLPVHVWNVALCVVCVFVCTCLHTHGYM